MKKTIILFTAFCLTASTMTSCGNTADNSMSETTTKKETISAIDTEIITAKKKDANTTTATTTAVDSEPETESLWDVSYTKDDWGEEHPEDPIITYLAKNGNFSNSFTTNSELVACIRFGKEDACFILWEYGHSILKGEEKYYTITIIDESDNSLEKDGVLFDQFLYYGDSDLLESREELKNLLINNKNLKVKIIKKNDYGTPHEYYFKIDSTGFKEAFEEAFGTI